MPRIVRKGMTRPGSAPVRLAPCVDGWRGTDKPCSWDEFALSRPSTGSSTRACIRDWAPETTKRRRLRGRGGTGPATGRAVYRSTLPAVGATRNLRELACHIEAPLFLAHVRAAIGSPVQETNCHPFRNGRLAVRAQRLYRRLPRHPARADAGGGARGASADILGSTDTEVLFHLALTFGPRGWIPSARSSGRSAWSRRSARAHGSEFPFQGSVGTSDGESLWAVALLVGGGRSRKPVRLGRHARPYASCIPENDRVQRLLDTDPRHRVRAARRSARLSGTRSRRRRPSRSTRAAPMERRGPSPRRPPDVTRERVNGRPPPDPPRRRPGQRCAPPVLHGRRDDRGGRGSVCPRARWPPDLAAQIVHDELMLDGNARLKPRHVSSRRGWSPPHAS